MTLQRFSDLPRALAAAGVDPDRYKAVLEDCNTFFARYADLEETILGGVSLQFPAHLLEETVPQDPLQAAEAIAGREHRRLNELDLGLNGMHAFLESQQLKVYRFNAGEGQSLLGFFLFDPICGPIFAADRSVLRGEADRVLARLYGHFLMDNDPYQIQLVWRDRELHSPSDLRAAAFATTFLVSKEALRKYLAAAAVEPQKITSEVLEQLSVYLGVDPTSVALRLVTLGWLDADAMKELVSTIQPDALERDPRCFGDRYVLLALEAHARNAIDLKTLAEYLETTPDDALLWKERFQLPETGSKQNE